MDTIAQRVSTLLKIPIEEVWSKGKYRRIVAARWAVNEIDMSLAEPAEKLEVSATTISQSVLRGRSLAQENEYQLESP